MTPSAWCALCSIGPILVGADPGHVLCPILDAAATPLCPSRRLEPRRRKSAALVCAMRFPPMLEEVAAGPAARSCVILYLFSSCSFRRFQRHQLGKMVRGPGLYLCGLGAFFSGGQRGLYARWCQYHRRIAVASRRNRVAAGAHRGAMWATLSSGPSRRFRCSARQVEEVSNGSIPRTSINHALSIGIASVGGPGYAADLDGHLHYVVSYSRLCSWPWP